MLQRGTLIEHKSRKMLGVIVGFKEWSPKSSFGHNVLVDWFFAPPEMYFNHDAEFPPCHYDAGAEQYVYEDFNIIGQLDLEATDAE